MYFGLVLHPSVILSMSQELCVLFFLPDIVILCLLFCPWFHLFLSQILNLFIVVLCLCGVYLDLFCISLMSLFCFLFSVSYLVPPWPCFVCPHNVYNVYCIAFIVSFVHIMSPFWLFSVPFCLYIFYFLLWQFLTLLCRNFESFYSVFLCFHFQFLFAFCYFIVI